MLEGDNEAHGGADAVRAKLALMEHNIYVGTEGMVADNVLTSRIRQLQGEGGDDDDSEAGGGSNNDIGARTMSQRSMARCGREQRSTAFGSLAERKCGGSKAIHTSSITGPRCKI
ncbi:hypothetical protein CYMTET_29014 [Cymbomonas tetramitiformis]|uniref:Uncharacterized protein n=1 Tax=Cymbomonas tetramitiformis TaxID=36881 RepID=A0AAE0KVK6_9CHLO|nr:hypothetical protein CYMTET_29014 [Cymbomonas tetramitiformis]